MYTVQASNHIAPKSTIVTCLSQKSITYIAIA